MGCAYGGKSQRAPFRARPPSSAGALTAARAPESPILTGLGTIAPAPTVRVGLSTDSASVRLTSSGSFRVGVGTHWISTHEVLVERDASARGTVEGWAYGVQLTSFSNESTARRLRARVVDETEESVTVVREPVTGRFAVRVGPFSRMAAAETARRELARLGYEWAKTVRESVKVPHPIGLVLRPIGQDSVFLDAMSLFAVPERPGAWIEVDGAPYRGYIELRVNGSNLFTAINVVNLEDYLKGVVPAELSPENFPENDAIKAQAIAARTYVVKRRGQYESEGYDLCATPTCQVYRGVGIEQPMSSNAVDETAGEILTYNGQPIDALYTSTCGGRTENAENVFSNPVPYLISRACYLETNPPIVTSSSGPRRTLEAATLEVLGIVEESGDSDEVDREKAVLALNRVLSVLGQQPCWRVPSSGNSSFDLVDLADLVAQGLCWERRLPYLVSSLDAMRLVTMSGLSDSERRYLGHAIHQGLVLPPGEGIRRGAPVSKDDLNRTLYRLMLRRGEQPLRTGTLVSLLQGRLTLQDDALGEEASRISSFLAPIRHLFRRSGDSTFYVSELALLPNDRVMYHMGDVGVDLLVLLSEGGSFDRSSRFSHWVVRKSNAELTRGINSREVVGDVVDLKPKRYGRSGRVVELDIVGTQATRTVRGLAIRRALGIRENLFFLDAQRSATGELRSWVFTGRGWGHGVGLCQVGAYGMAAAGYDYRKILSHYYPGTRLRRWLLDESVADIDKAHHAP